MEVIQPFEQSDATRDDTAGLRAEVAYQRRSSVFILCAEFASHAHQRADHLRVTQFRGIVQRRAAEGVLGRCLDPALKEHVHCLHRSELRRSMEHLHNENITGQR